VTLAALELLIGLCAPSVAPTTLLAIIQAESAGVPHAVHVNGPWVARPANRGEAARIARWAIRAGYTVDLGLMQVNSRNLPGLGLSIEDALDPCTNVWAGAAILSANYAAMAARHGPDQRALLDALSAYNTGNARGGFANGYVRRVLETHRLLMHDKAKRRRK
jgi:type IV secretion system protein VirB1